MRSGETVVTEYVNPIPVAACIVMNKGRVLLLKRVIEPCAGGWSLPSGHYEVGENAEQGIVREILEETGLDVDVTYLCSGAKVAPNGKHYLSLLFVARTDVEEIVLDDENSEWAWVPLSEPDLDRYEWAFPNQKKAVLQFIHSGSR